MWMCKVWFSSCPGSESLPLFYSSRNSEVARAQITFLPFSTGTRHLDGVFLWSFYARLVRSTRLMSNKMQENVAKNGWELTKVARIGRSRSLYGQTRVEGGVGQSREPKLIVCCLHNSAHPFLAKKRPGAPVFGHCPNKKLAKLLFGIFPFRFVGKSVEVLIASLHRCSEYLGVKYFREKILQVHHVLAVIGLCVLRDAASTRSISGVEHDTACPSRFFLWFDTL